GEHFLPPEANELLKTLQSQSPPVAWGEIHRILSNAWGEKLEEFEIDPQPVGSASLGQVHKAFHKPSQKWKAIKVQYPGVDLAIDTDLRAIRSFLGLLKLLPSQFKTDHLFAEIREMLIQEMDYVQEARQTMAYRTRLHGDPRFIVPEVDEAFSSAKILVTSFEPGVAVDSPEVQGLPQKDRNQLALDFLDLYFQELFQWGVVQTDPHLGNYRVRLAEGQKPRFILFDFGAVRTYPMEFRKPYYQMISAALHSDRRALSEAARRLQFIQDGDSERLQKFFEDFCLGTVEPFLTSDHPGHNPEFLSLHDEYDWKRSDLPQRLSKIVFSMISEFQVRTPPREILFLDRKTGGVFIFLSVLKAKVKARPLLDLYLKRALTGG
ncbi:MAG: AarF/ABC1/UbiB kinase family protein, partial [Bdellovibrio sp.]